ncbi:DNA-3-methyladenine glycosylase I [Pseudogemmobacter blasticus]|uniref:3-methyladenine DNA glycosylase n=1 Tax=Fuscovulum blasticum DSM 2131 TaxID=1188250 RepID=A0A2T4J6X3_FUSBL|nr:DNA-3-methyladenine glycosylase I [Fuscovulum blasticum]PTE13567.1 3-methyladenine DNA glycosylase [Fuscovulum blasticum DSM 2131]
MRPFAEIRDIAIARKGSLEAVLANLPVPRTAAELAAIPDDRWLAQMAKGIFQAGISWTVVTAKWPGIESAFHGFAPGRVAMIEGDALEALLSDPRVIRSGAKIVAIRDNAAVMAASPGFGRKVADWPASDFVGLLDWLTRDFSRLGGTTGQYLMRFMGKDGFLLSRDVVARLQAEGVIDGPATSAKARRAIQAAFDRWQAESGLSQSQISRILAQSIDAA